ncbi:MAG: 5'(3')-deoxyribonucleotidase [Bacteroidota bacterium]|nr:5'(3')-deoxyribonucleotidase [Bacteroidota bacterium]MDP4216714.1 5'(3')-deoxyribonucleotidase [Bacteroidota bacterium]MDP4245960.1 5'(3')-deoxyribonucleotidase [Bacteroidota bacterium]MDP4253587.1 5'(3')-deoxyribonucleotidase [Bacteroidota bacterium]MDP4257258.1 5'(3')-deoxyribonucleotidase [Bacteroidota bacterium]
MAKKRLIIDMDHVMADITSQYIKWFKEATGIEMQRQDLLGKPEDQAFPDPQLVRKFLHTPGFFRSAPVIAGSQEVIRELNDSYDLFIVSAAMEFPQSLSEKFEWLQEHFPFIHWQQVILCGSKRPISGDFMIDDHLKNLDHFNGEKLLFSATHNSDIDNSAYTRVNNWDEVRRLLLQLHALA